MAMYKCKIYLKRTGLMGSRRYVAWSPLPGLFSRKFYSNFFRWQLGSGWTWKRDTSRRPPGLLPSSDSLASGVQHHFARVSVVIWFIFNLKIVSRVFGSSEPHTLCKLSGVERWTPVKDGENITLLESNCTNCCCCCCGCSCCWWW